MTISRATLPVFMLLLVCVMVLTGCAHRPITSEVNRWQNARQMVVVTIAGWDTNHGSLRTYQRNDIGDPWQEIGHANPVTIGRTGAAWGLGLHSMPPSSASSGPIKREGDGRSPAGIFSIGEAFGYAPNVTTALPYAAMQASHYCVDVSGAPLYNQIVDANVVGSAAVEGSTEPMRRDLHADGDQRYRLGFVIEHNAQARPMGGSCIFAHLWKSPTDATSGCTAMEPATMTALLSWLRPDQHPVFVLLPINEYVRLQGPWHLPKM